MKEIKYINSFFEKTRQIRKIYFLKKQGKYKKFLKPVTLKKNCFQKKHKTLFNLKAKMFHLWKH